MPENDVVLRAPTAVLVCVEGAACDRLLHLLRTAGLQVHVFDRAEAALAALDPAQPPDLMVVEVSLADLDGWRVGRLLRSPEYPTFQRVPVLVVLAAFAVLRDDLTPLLVADLDSANRVPTALDDEQFVARVQAVLRGEELTPTPRALIVSADTVLVDRLATALEEGGYAVTGAMTADAAGAVLAAGDCDVVVLDSALPDGAAAAVLDMFHACQSDGICVLLLADPQPGSTRAWLQRGATACVLPPADPSHLIQLCAQLRRERAVLRADRLLAAAQARYRSLVDLSPYGIGLVDLNGRIVEVNRQVAAMFGYAHPDELVGLNLFDLFAPEEADWVREGIRQLLAQGGGVRAVERQLQRRNGERFCGEIRAVVMYGDDGRPTGLMGVVSDITEAKRTAAALVESERHLRELAANLPGAIFQFVRDRDGHYTTTFVSDGAVDLLGQPVEVLLDPMRLFENLHPDDVAGMWSSIRASEQNLSRWRHEFRIIMPTGETRWVQGTSNPTPREDGSIVWNGILLDITDRKRAEAEIAERERRYNLLVENVPGFVYRCRNDRDWTMQFISDGCRAVTGYAPEDFIDNRTLAYNDIILPEWREALWQRWQASLAEGRPCEVEYPIRSADGQIRWVWERGRGVCDDDGHLCFLEGYIEDISARKQAEVAVRQSEEKYRTLFEQSSQGIYLHDFDGHILDVNEMACQQSGYARDELLQMTVFDLHPTWSDAVFIPKEEILRLWREWPPDHRIVLEAAHRRKDGTVYPVEVATGVIRYGDRNLILAIVQDITARKRAEEEREKLQAQLSHAQKMESVGRLAGGVAHDFNNMLTAILGYTELALHSLDPATPLHHYLEEVHKAARRSADLTHQLLAFARRQTIAPKVLDLNQTVEGMLKLLRRLIGEDIDLAWMPGAGLWPVRVDPSQVDQILANLCVNARDAIGGVGRITIETANVTPDDNWYAEHPDGQLGDYVMLAVSDTGCGMDEATLAHLFEPFFTTKAVGQGTGLGLATVYGIVTQNHGCIDVTSAPGRGTTFRIYLPRHIGEAEQPEQRAPEPATRGRETILLVEDEPAIVDLGQAMLGQLGYAVLTARTPGEALRLAREHPGDIHLLMTDVIMPEMNGRDLAREIQAVRPGLKCLFMSGYTADVVVQRGIVDPGVYFLQKPFTFNQLAALLREALANHPTASSS